MDYPIITWTIAILGSVIGLGSLVHLSWIARSWTRVEGVVTGNTNKTNHGGPKQPSTRYYIPKIKFTAANGQQHVVHGDVGRSEPHIIGSVIQLRYKPSNPNHAMTMNWWQRLLFSGAFIAFGLVCWLLIFGVIDS